MNTLYILWSFQNVRDRSLITGGGYETVPCTALREEGGTGASVVLRLQKRGSEKALATLQGKGIGHNKFWGNQRSQPCFTPPVVHG